MVETTRRRALLAGASILAAPALLAGFGAAVEATAQEPAKSAQAPGFFRFKVGDATVPAIYDGYFARPLKVLFAISTWPLSRTS
jgi:hypothetical protein